jgi:hypothetical protein
MLRLRASGSGRAPLVNRFAVHEKGHVWANQRTDGTAGASAGRFVKRDRPVTTCVEGGGKVKDVLRAGVNAQLAAFTAICVDLDGSSCHVALL